MGVAGRVEEIIPECKAVVELAAITVKPPVDTGRISKPERGGGREGGEISGRTTAGGRGESGITIGGEIEDG